MSKPFVPETLRSVAMPLGLGALAVLAAVPRLSAAEPVDGETVVAEADQRFLESMLVTGRRPLVNPYADPAAPYKVDRSGNGKFTEELLDTPKTITAIPKEVIQDLGASTFRDVMRTQPGITLGTGEGGNAYGDRIFIRGFDARNDVYIDGLRDPGVGTRETFDIEQIEVVKGPGSTFAGRGSTGGAVNIISKSAQSLNSAAAEVTFGTDATKRVVADVNRAVTEKLSVRANGMWHRADVAGRDAVFQRRWGGAISAELRPADALSLTLDYYHLHTNDLPDWGMPFNPSTQRPFEGVSRKTFYGLVDRDFMRSETDIVTGTLTWNVTADLTLKSRARWGETENAYVVSAPERPNFSSADPSLWTVSSNPKNRNNDNIYYVNQTDLTYEFATGYWTHTLVGGVEFSHERIFNRPFGFNAESAGDPFPPTAIVQPLLSPNPYQALNVIAVPGANFTRVAVETKAVYFVDTIKFSKRWEAVGGVRYDNYEIEHLAGGGATSELTNTSSLVNWFSGLVYKPVENGTLYASAGTSSNPSGEQVDANGDAYGGLTAASAALDPERTRSYEIGIKWNLFDRHLNVAGALFRTSKSNARVNDPTAGGALVLDGKLLVQGAELSLGGNITPRWNMFGGLTVLETEVEKSANPADVGKRFPNVSAITFSLLSSYQVLDRLRVGGQAYYASAKHGGTVSVTSATIPAYWRFDLNATYQVTPHVAFRINALNVADKVYYDAIYRSGTPFAYIAPGRSVLFSLAASY